MRKTDKKTDNLLRAALTDACEIALEKYKAFKWLTHFVNYQNFPISLSIVCVFDTHENISTANCEGLIFIIKNALSSSNINIKDIHQHISFDSEEACEKENNGKWNERFK